VNWLEEVRLELQRAEAAKQSGNAGKARTSARRGVGIALTEFQRMHREKNYGKDFIGQLRGFSSDPSVPEEVRAAAERLGARLSPSFESPSRDPVGDANVIIAFIAAQLA
jgi:hypothetical protein